MATLAQKLEARGLPHKVAQILVAGVLQPDGSVAATAPIQLASYTVGALPAAATWPRGMIYVSDGTANKRLAVSDGTNWRWPDGAIVS